MSSQASRLLKLFLLLICLSGCKRNESPPQAKAPAAPVLSEQFLSLMNAGKNSLDQGDATNALATYRRAAVLAPNDLDLHLNLGIAALQSGAPRETLKEAEESLKLEPNSAAAYFLRGSAYLRLGNSEEAVKAFQNSKKIDPGEIATLFQLGLSHMGLKQWDAAIAAFQEGLRMDPNHLHAPVHYLLGQALLRSGKQQEGERELQQFAANVEGAGPSSTASPFERSKFTQARVPFKLEQPEKEGIKMRFVDATQEVLGEQAASFSGPIGVINFNRSGRSSLFVFEKGQGFRLLSNIDGSLKPLGGIVPSLPGARYSRMLVGDLQNDRFEDVIVLGDSGSHLFKFATNGVISDASQSSGLNALKATDGLLMDLDFTGKLDLLAIGAQSGIPRIYRQFGPLNFSEITSTSGIPSTLQNAELAVMEDWNRDQVMDVIASRKGQAPLFLEKERGGKLIPREMGNWPPATLFCTGDFDNDLRPDLAAVGDQRIYLCSNGGERKEIPAPGLTAVRQIIAVDYDNDGWLDLWTVGDKIRVWRNTGLSGFIEQTAQLGLDSFNPGPIAEIHFADFDFDCDSDAVLALANGGLRYLKNEGGNSNSQVKVQLMGNRSNASGIGCKVEIETGGLRLLRTVQHLPVEVGVGKYQKLDSFLVHWFNWPQGSAETAVDCKEPLLALELTIQEGSCPYLYAWDGKRFRFVTDILGAAPLGLPLAEGRYIEADPEEFVWLGDEKNFQPKGEYFEVQITEELREVLYLDEAKLVVLDHDPATEVYPTGKLLPGKPYPKGTLLTVRNEHPLVRAETLDGTDVTTALRKADGIRVSPPRLREPQLRGLAEPHGLVLDFGALDAAKPLVLVMNGWLRFGGGMANIAASHDPSLPFPFPTLEAETAPGGWNPVDVRVGAPAGKTKTILVDLQGKLPPGVRRLRLREAFEIHWDRIALMEKASGENAIVSLEPSKADLHFRGFSGLRDLPPDSPVTPDYTRVSPNFYWTITPGGWCTRYGDVAELLSKRDEAMALLNSGDELTLKFSARSLPPKPAGKVRDYFLYVDGWDKDSDFHVAAGTEVGPLPYHGMNDQLYGRGKRPPFPSDSMHQKYNTRWVESSVLKMTTRQPQPSVYIQP